jgi:hypothetical protein
MGNPRSVAMIVQPVSVYLSEISEKSKNSDNLVGGATPRNSNKSSDPRQKSTATRKFHGSAATEIMGQDETLEAFPHIV